MRRLIPILILATLVSSAAAWADDPSPTITVDFSKQTVSPAYPTFNLNGTSSIRLVITPASDDYKITPSATAPNSVLVAKRQALNRANATLRTRKAKLSAATQKLVNLQAPRLRLLADKQLSREHTNETLTGLTTKNRDPKTGKIKSTPQIEAALGDLGDVNTAINKASQPSDEETTAAGEAAAAQKDVDEATANVTATTTDLETAIDDAKTNSANDFTAGRQIAFNFISELSSDPRCKDHKGDLSIPDSTSDSWTVCLAPEFPRAYVVKIEGPKSLSAVTQTPPPPDVKAAIEPAKQTTSISVVIMITNSSYSLDFAEGFAFSGLRDQRYRVEPATGTDSANSQTENLMRVQPNGPISSALAVYAHYCFVKRSLSFMCPVSVGLATNLSSGIEIVVGPSFRITTLPLVNSAFFTFGAVYGPRKVLNDDYVGVKNPTVGTGTSASSLLTSKNGLSGFVGISFGFLGGSADTFRGVYQGKGSSTGSSSSTSQ